MREARTRASKANSDLEIKQQYRIKTRRRGQTGFGASTLVQVWSLLLRGRPASVGPAALHCSALICALHSALCLRCDFVIIEPVLVGLWASLDLELNWLPYAYASLQVQVVDGISK
ncbi:uncharacterized protein TrAFT101_005630 [Trichoderma asperellum]|uniref:uncharacterized protein n=1 Tax=Trichoderma asperellum TaxID=101201 RepID=UPI003325A0EE|nr:hypothetical protein TrAFT101_005630 [Trichoderma asperellum]